MRGKDGPIVLGDYPNACKRAIHSLRVSHFSDDNVLTRNIAPSDWSNKPRNHLIKGFQALVGFELLPCIKACLSDEISKQIRRFYGRQTLWIELFTRNACWVNPYDLYLFKVSSPYLLFLSPGVLWQHRNIEGKGVRVFSFFVR